MTVPLSLLTDLCLSSTHRNKSGSIDEPEMGEGQEQVFPAQSNVKEQPFAGQPLAAHPLLHCCFAAKALSVAHRVHKPIIQLLHPIVK